MKSRLALALATLVCLGLWIRISPATGPLNLKGPGTGSRGGVLFSVAITSNAVALTFDDGPSPELTPAVLDLLHRYSARATFFPIGQQVEQYPNLMKQVAAEGHEIGNHTYSHTYFRPGWERQLKEELNHSEEVMTRVLGTSPTLFRFPGLAYDASLVSTAVSEGYTVVSCSLDSYDWRVKNGTALADRVVGMIGPGDIILMHDGNWVDPQKELDGLALILKTLQAKGYEFITISELIDRGLAEESDHAGSPGE